MRDDLCNVDCVCVREEVCAMRNVKCWKPQSAGRKCSEKSKPMLMIPTTRGVSRPKEGQSPTMKEMKEVTPASVATSTMPGATICQGQEVPCTWRSHTTQ